MSRVVEGELSRDGSRHCGLGGCSISPISCSRTSWRRSAVGPARRRALARRRSLLTIRHYAISPQSTSSLRVPGSPICGRPLVSTPSPSMAVRSRSTKRLRHAPHSRRCCISARKSRRHSRACSWLRRCPGISQRRATVRTMLPEHDVFVTDWHNARDIPLTAGRFGVDEYTDHLIKFLEVIGPPAHILAVCQPCVAVMAAVAVMAQAGNPTQPRSMTLMAGPIDARITPTKVNELAKKRSMDWFERALTASVPLLYPGAFRRVYPGFVQLVAFMSMNIERHVKAHRELYEHLANGEIEKAAVTKAFYDEYFAVLDLTAEFYLDTVRLIFQDHALPLGRLEWHGQRVDPNAIRKTMLFTVEGERDDICAVGQTVAAHELCGKLRPYLRRHHMQAGVGHYGVFSGKRWENQIYPILKNVILSSD